MADDRPTLRLVDRRQKPADAGPPAGRRVLVSWEAPGMLPREASVEVDVQVDAVAAEKVRWYLED